MYLKRNDCSVDFSRKISNFENQCLTEKMNRAMLLMLATDKGFRPKKNGQLFKNLKLSGQVEATGQLSNFLDDLKLLCDSV